MRNKFLIVLFYFVSIKALAQGEISGPTSVTQNTSHTYTYVEEGGMLLMPNWSIEGGGTITNTTEVGATYTATISWTSTGVKGLTFKNASTVKGELSVVVNAPETTLVPGSITATTGTTICYNDNPGNINNSVSASGGTGSFSYQWQYSTNGGSSWTNSGSATSSPTSINPPALTSQRKYRRRVISGTQTKYSNVITYTVYANLNAGTLTYTGGNVNPGGNPPNISGSTPTGGDGSYTYQWQKKTTGSYSNISGATGKDYNPGTQNVSTTYRRLVSACSGENYPTNEIKITVNLLAGGINSDQTICTNANPAPFTSVAPSGGNGSYSYEWFYVQRNLNGTWPTVYQELGVTTATYDPPVLLLERKYKRLVSSEGQSVYSNIVTITHQELTNAGSISYSGGNVNPGGNPPTINGTVATAGNDLVYQWQKKTTGSFSNISGATGQNYDPPSQSITTTYRRRATSCGSTLYTNQITITVNLVAGTIGSDQNVCQAEVPAPLTSSANATGASGGYTYQWQHSTENSSGVWSGYSNISGATGTTYAPTGGYLFGVKFRRRVISGGQTKYSNIVTITDQSLEDPGTLTYSGGNINAGGNPIQIEGTAAVAGDDLTYQWQSKTTGSFANISGATSEDYNPGVLNVSTTYRRVSSSCSATLNSNEAKITVTLTPGSISSSSASTICYNGNPGIINSSGLPTGGTGSFTYQWQKRVYSGGSWGSWTNISGQTSTTYNPPALTETTRFRRRVQSDGQTKYSNYRQYTVHSELIAGTLSYSGGNINPDVNPSIITGTVPTNGDGSYTYQWQQKTTGSFSNISGATSKDYDPPNPLNVSTTYRRLDSSCSGENYPTNEIKITINLIAGSINADQTICPNDDPAPFTSVAPSGGNGSYSYEWFYVQRNLNGTWPTVYQELGVTTETYDPPVLLLERKYHRLVSSDGQSTGSNIATISHQDLESAGTISYAGGNIAAGTTPQTITGTDAVAGDDLVYSWKSKTNGSYGPPLSGENSKDLSPGPLNVTTTFQRTATSCSASMTSNEITINVTLNAGNIGSDQIICTTSPVVIMSQASPLGGDGSYTYQWKRRLVGNTSWENLGLGAMEIDYNPATADFISVPMEYMREVTSEGNTVMSNIVTITPQALANGGSLTYSGGEIPINTIPSAITGSDVEADQGLTGVIYQWSKKALSEPGYTNISGATGVSYTPTAAISEPTFYKRTASLCVATKTATATVNIDYPSLVGGSVTATEPAICFGNLDPAVIVGDTPTGGYPVYTYQWQEQNQLVPNWTDIPGATSKDYDPNNHHPLVTSFNYRRVVTAYNESVTSSVVTINALNFPGPGTITASGSTTKNSGDNIEVIVGSDLVTGDTPQYQWYKKFTTDTDWSLISGATDRDYTPPNATYSVSYKRWASSCGGSDYSSPVDITVNTDPGSIGSDQIICASSPVVIMSQTAPSGGDGNYAYQWKWRLVGNTLWDDLGLGAMTLDYDPLTADFISVPMEYMREVTSEGITVMSNIVTITPQALANGGSLTYSGGEIPINTIPSAITGSDVEVDQGLTGVTYQWSKKGLSEPGYTDISGATDISYTPTIAITEPTFYKRTASLCGVSKTATATVNIDYAPLDVGDITPTDVIFCYTCDPGTIVGDTPSGGYPVYSYQWQEQHELTLVWSNILENGTGKDYDPPAVDPSSSKLSFTYRRVVTAYNETVEGPAVTISRNLPLGSGTISHDITPCEGGSLGTITGTAGQNGMGGYSYKWEKYNGTTWDVVAEGAQYQNYSSFDLLSTQVQYRRTVTDSQGDVAQTPSLVINPVECEQTAINYVRVESLRSPVSDVSLLPTLTHQQKTTSYAYADGQGRPTMRVIAQAGPNQEDVVSFNTYDLATGRQLQADLPYTIASTDPGSFRHTFESEQSLFYQQGGEVVTDARPYSSFEYESSPWGRVKSVIAPGAAHHDNTKKTSYSYAIYDGNDAGTADEVHHWKLLAGLPVLDASDDYGSSSLRVAEVTTPDGRKAQTITDSRGLTIATRKWDGTNWNTTYNIYDDFGRLRFIVPPAMATNTSLSQAQIDGYLFEYRYDGRGRIVESRSPGAGWSYAVYDEWNRLVMSRHDGQKDGSGNATWTFFKYDKFNRQVLSGIVTTSKTRSTIQTELDAATAGATPTAVRYEDLANDQYGYTLDRSFPDLTHADYNTYEVHSISYLDDYTFMSNTGWDAETLDFSFNMPAGFTADSTSHVLGLPTGGKTRILGTNTWLNSVVYYDNRLRPIQVISENHLGGTDRATNEMDYVGQVLKTKLEHAGNESLDVLTEYSYDHAGRLQQTHETVGTSPRTLVGDYKYNALGELVEKNLHSTDGGTSFLQSVDYRYTIQSQLKSINNSQLTQGSEATQDVFGMELNYTDGVTVNGQSITPSYDGNIASATWNWDESPTTAGTQGGSLSIYGYSYNSLNQLTTANYATDNSGTWTGNSGHFDMTASYDANGNTETLTRKADGTTIDNLSYTYETTSNKLQGVTDNSSNAEGMNDGYPAPTDYQYNTMGNRTEDLNKEIVEINYNHLQLVTSVEFNDGTKLTNLYNASGGKLSKTITDADDNIISKVDYIGSIEYLDDEINQVFIEGGRAYKQNGNFHNEYFISDHQGNNRVAFGNLPERNIYTATMETEESAMEESEFDFPANIRSTANNHTPLGNESVTLNHAVGRSVGPAKVLTIANGDHVELETWVRYDAAVSATGTFNDIAAAILSTLGLSTGDAGAGDAVNAAVGSGGSADYVPTSSAANATDAPDAYLQYLFFDTNYTFVAANSGFIKATDAAYNAFEKLEVANGLDFTQAGYLYIYVANETHEDQEVYFDDLKITHENSTTSFKVSQENEYYPYGLPTSNSYRAEGYIDPGLLYQAAFAEFDELTGNYSFAFRDYDPALGQFFAVDPLAAATSGYSPYHANYNNPVMFTDPLGLMPDTRWKDFGTNYNDGATGNNDGYLDYLAGPSSLQLAGSLTGPSVVDMRPLSNIVGSLFNGTFGGTWSEAAGFHYFGSVAEAVRSGWAYVDKHGGLAETKYGPVKGKRRLAQLNETGEFVQLGDGRLYVPYTDIFYSDYIKPNYKSGGGSSLQDDISRELFFLSLTVEPFKKGSNILIESNEELVRTAVRNGNTTKLAAHKNIYNGGLKFGKIVRVGAGTVIVAGIASDAIFGFYYASQGNALEAGYSFESAGIGVISAAMGPPGAVFYGLMLVAPERGPAISATYISPIVQMSDNTRVISPYNLLMR